MSIMGTPPTGSLANKAESQAESALDGVKGMYWRKDTLQHSVGAYPLYAHRRFSGNPLSGMNGDHDLVSPPSGGKRDQVIWQWFSIHRDGRPA